MIASFASSICGSHTMHPAESIMHVAESSDPSIDHTRLRACLIVSTCADRFSVLLASCYFYIYRQRQLADWTCYIHHFLFICFAEEKNYNVAPPALLVST
jgi:hypothetical protein